MVDLSMNDGRTIPAIGFGSYKIAADAAAGLAGTAIKTGYRLVDTAAFYGNEAGVGTATVGTGTFITTKLWRDAMGYDAALRAFDDSLAALGQSDVDLYLIHWPVPAEGRYVDTWKALIRLREEGRAKSIGVSNFMPTTSTGSWMRPAWSRR